jgi:hypothetical protein
MKNTMVKHLISVLRQGFKLYLKKDGKYFRERLVYSYGSLYLEKVEIRKPTLSEVKDYIKNGFSL